MFAYGTECLPMTKYRCVFKPLSKTPTINFDSDHHKTPTDTHTNVLLKFHDNLLVILQLLVNDRKVVMTNSGIKNGLSGCMQFTPQNGARTYRDIMGQSDAGDGVNLGSSKFNGSFTLTIFLKRVIFIGLK